MTATLEAVPATGRPRRMAKGPRRPLTPKSLIGKIVLYVVLIAGAVPTLLPLIWLVRSALMESGQIFISPPEWIPDPFAFDNFSGALTQVPFARYFLNT
jgi:multiple sugar transport system permease protein